MARRLIAGQRNANEWGFWVTKPGKDVFSTSPIDFLISPDVPLMPGYMSGLINSLPLLSTTEISSTNWQGNYGVTIPHNLGYIPLVLMGASSAYVNLDTVNLYIKVSLGYPSQSAIPSSVNLTTMTPYKDQTVIYYILAFQVSGA